MRWVMSGLDWVGWGWVVMSWVGKWVGLGWVEVGKEEWGWVELRWAVGWVGVNRDGLG